MAESRRESRRSFLGRASGAGLLIASGAKEDAGEDVSPAEDLMREHGVLDRVLLIYDECIRRLAAAEDLPPAVLEGSARIVRSFIEDYHEKLEEDARFPRFEKVRQQLELVGVLRAQHQAGRHLTGTIEKLAAGAALRNAADRGQLADALRRFVRMYRPHAAREDTVLFPALHQLVSHREYDAMGEDFERKEHDLFGERGFERFVDEVAGLERQLGIADLAQFTPR
jgi:hemerythrin-like domain-containing protein